MTQISQTSLKDVFTAGGPDPSRLTSGMQFAGMGDMLARQRHLLTLNVAHFIRLSDSGFPPMRAQAVISNGRDWWLPAYTFTLEVPAGDDGLTVGSGNGAVRVIAKEGWSVRFGIVNPGTDGPTGTYYLASQPLSVKVAIAGKFAEIWVLAANDASIATTSIASAVRAEILASEDAMRALSTVDYDGGDGTGIVTAAPSLATSSVVVAATVAAPPTVIPGRVYVSFDGDMLLANDYALCGDPWDMARPHAEGLGPRNQWSPGPALAWTPMLWIGRHFVPDALSEDPVDLAARDNIVYVYHYLFVDAVRTGMLDMDLDKTAETEIPGLAGTIDWLGVQYYFRAGVTALKAMTIWSAFVCVASESRVRRRMASDSR